MLYLFYAFFTIQFSKSFFNKTYQRIDLYVKRAETIMASLDLCQGRGAKSMCIAFHRALTRPDSI